MLLAQHQIDAVEFARVREGSMIQGGLGIGKTRIGLAMIKEMRWNHRVLVLCPKVVRSIWYDEYIDHSYSISTDFVVPEGTTENRRLQIRYLTPPYVVVLNYESALRLKDDLLRSEWDLLILDESHRIKSFSSGISRLAGRLATRSTRRLLLTGTPADKPTDWLGQFRALDKRVLGTKTDFHRRYCVHGNPHIPQQITGYRNLPELGERIEPYIKRIDTKDVLDLPESSDTIIKVQMGAQGMRRYRKMESEFVISLDDEREIIAENDLVRLLRLAQMTGGTMETEDGVIKVDDAKEKALRDWLDDVDEPVVVVCRFSADIAAVHRAAEGRSLELSGRRDELKEWQDGKAQVLALQIKTGGVGISLVRAAVMMFYSVGYSLIDIEQARGRVLRPGQERRVRYIHLVARGTIDERIAYAHKQKLDVLDQVKEWVRWRR